MVNNDFSWGKKYNWDIVVAFTIVALPFFIYAHLAIDESETFLIFNYLVDNRFSNTQTFFWFVLSKLIPLALCVIWLLVSLYWWRKIILIPIGLYTFSFVNSIFFEASQTLHSISWSVAIMLLICLLIYIVEGSILRQYRKKSIQIMDSKLTNQKLAFKKISKQFTNLRTKKKVIDDHEYSIRLMFVENLIKNNCIDHLQGGSKFLFGFRKILLYDYLIIGAILMAPLLYNLHHLIPVNTTEYQIAGIIFSSNGFVDFNTYIWFLSTKACVLLLMVIWFYTSTSWWRYSILSPVILYTYQIWETIQGERYLDAFGNLRAFPAVFAVIFVLIFLSNRFKYRAGLLDLREEIISELDYSISKAAKKGIIEIDQLEKYRDKGSSKIIGKQSDGYLDKLIDLEKRIKYKLNLKS